ncbi:MAG: MipA/OmpV family protein [Litoreibacter sp.]|nr:MipA/OmpV family protein [Litoreibacter sp.]
MSNSKILIVTILPALSMGSGAIADGKWTLGLIAAGETGYYVGEKDEIGLLPYISYETERFEVSLHDGLAYHVIKNEGPDGSAVQLSFLLTPRWEPHFGDDPIVNGLKRDTALELGVSGIYEKDIFFVQTEALADVSDTHSGYEASAVVGLQQDFGAFSLEGGIGARYRSSDLNRHLFGVSATEANARRAAFNPGSSTTGFASISAAYAIGANTALVGDISFEDFGKMEVSPLVDEGSNTSFALGLIHQF